MALFTDNNKYAAEVIDVHPDLKYTVKFYDGIVKKNIPESSLDKFTEKASREAQLKAEELYGAKLNKPESPILDRSERRRSISRPRSGTDLYSDIMKQILNITLYLSTPKSYILQSFERNR